MNANQLKSAITEKTKMVWFSSPCNPSGSVYSKKELQEISMVLESYKGIFIVSDAKKELGKISDIRDMFIGFQEYLYAD